MTATVRVDPLVAVYTDWDPTFDVEIGRGMLEAEGWETRMLASADPESIVTGARDAVALCVGLARIDAPVIERLTRLRVISTASTGTDMIDTEAAATRGIEVKGVGGAATDEVASHSLAMMLALLRHLPEFDRGVRDGRWAIDPGLRVRRISTLTLGVVGFGRIGRRLAQVAGPLFERIIAFDPFAPSEGWPPTIDSTPLDALLGAADVVSLHLPLTPATRNIIDAARLAQFRPSAVLVNVSRGELIDMPALLDALDSGRLGAAALDVLPAEPPDPDDPVLRHPRVLLSPHAAFLSDESARDYVRIQAINVLEWQQRSFSRDARDGAA